MEILYDRGLLRQQILQAIRDNASNGYSLMMLYDRIKHHYAGRESHELRNCTFEEVFRLLSEGIIRPNYIIDGTQAKLFWDHFNLTEYGKSIIRHGAEHPFFEEDYLSRLRSMIPEGMELSSVVEFYVKESVKLFRYEFYSSTVVMLGVGSEQVVDQLGYAVLDTLKEATKGKFRIVMGHRSISDKIKIIRSTFESSCSDADLKDFFDHAFTGFVTLLRKSRNEYGHPSITSATRDEALEYLYTFPQYIKRMYQVIEYYNNKRIEESEL